MLEEQGLVRKIPYRGAFVAEVSPRAVNEVASLRRLVEPFALERSRHWLRTEGRPRFEAALSAMTAATAEHDISSCLDAHLLFHRLVYEGADHELLLGLWTSWENQLRVFLAADMRAFGDPTDIAADHATLFGLIQAGDDRGASRFLLRHIHDAAELSPDG
jgi:DNA-binding GntR family transcriptional regulator